MYYLCSFSLSQAFSKQFKSPISVIVIRCGSVTAYLSLDFTQSVNIPDILSVLKMTAKGDGFGDFQIDPGSIQAISDEQLPTDSPISTQEPTSTRKS